MFKKDFLWGVSTAAYQIEGAYNEDGRGLSIWDVWSHEPGITTRGHNGDVACDFYHRYKEDIKLMADLGVNVYRFSISWSRVLPEGIGEVNEKGMQFYSDVVDECLKYGITPFVTLYHWDLPHALFLRGGWLSPEMPKWFEYYTEVVANRLGDRVKNFITLNEPQCFVNGGMANPDHAPGIRYTVRDQLQAIHMVLLAHGYSVRALRRIVKDVKIGYAPCAWVIIPKSDSKEDIELAREYYFEVHSHCPAGTVSVFSDPICLGDYPQEYYEKFGDILPKITKEDLEIISSPIDFYCQNIYSGAYTAKDKYGNFLWITPDESSPLTGMDWDIMPEALYWGPKFLYERYKLPIIISENGVACPDVVMKDGKVHDPQRIDYLDRYISALKKVADEVPIEGYFLWSFMDNYEWKCGYTKRFGLVFIDYKTQQRIPKDSYYFYKEVIKTNGENLK